MSSPSLSAKDILLIALSGFGVFYVVVLWRGLAEARKLGMHAAESPTPTAGGLATGFFTNFWDTLGIGSFATTTAIFRQFKMVRDELIPGTLNAGHTLPTIAQAFIFTKLVPVDSKTLILMILAAVAGSWLGAGFISKWPRRAIQVGMGFALVIAAVLMLLTNLHIGPAGGTAEGLTGTKLVIGMAGNFLLGALMTLGIGLYGPCMILVYVLGMNPKVAFPIMMGSCAFLMPVATARFIKSQKYNLRATLALALGGIPAVFIAAPLVNKLKIETIRYLVVVVVVYAAVSLLLAAKREHSKTSDLQAGA